MYVGIAGIKKGRTLRDRIYQDHLNQNSKGSTLRQTLAAILYHKIGLEPAMQLNSIHEKEILNSWIFDNAKVAWISIDNPRKLEKTVLCEYGEYLPFNLESNPKNPFRKSIMTLRKSWKKGEYNPDVLGTNE